MLPQGALQDRRAVPADGPVVRHRERLVQSRRVVPRQQLLGAHARQHAGEREPRCAIVATQAGQYAGAGGARRGQDGAGDRRGKGRVEVGVGDEILFFFF